VCHAKVHRIDIGHDDVRRERTPMTARNALAIVLLVAGGVLLYFGLQATDAPLERARQTLTGDYSDQTMLYLIVGGIAAVAGLALLFVRGRR
jgi:hypothetical protein